MHEETVPERWAKENHPDPRKQPIREVEPIEGPALNRYAAIIMAIIGALVAMLGAVTSILPLLVAGCAVLAVGILWYVLGRLTKSA